MMQVRDSSGTKTKDFPHLNSAPEDKADFFWSNGHKTHSRLRGRKKVKGKLVRRTIPMRRKSAWQP